MMSLFSYQSCKIPPPPNCKGCCCCRKHQWQFLNKGVQFQKLQGCYSVKPQRTKPYQCMLFHCKITIAPPPTERINSDPFDSSRPFFADCLSTKDSHHNDNNNSDQSKTHWNNIPYPRIARYAHQWLTSFSSALLARRVKRERVSETNRRIQQPKSPWTALACWWSPKLSLL